MFLADGGWREGEGGGKRRNRHKSTRGVGGAVVLTVRRMAAGRGGCSGRRWDLEGKTGGGGASLSGCCCPQAVLWELP